MRNLLAPVFDLRLGDVTEHKAVALYERATKEPCKKTGLPLRPATHRFYLSIVQCMWKWKWAQKQGYTQQNPWVEVEPIGRVSSGKPQLRPAEARRFAQVAEQEAAAGSGVALAALGCLNVHQDDVGPLRDRGGRDGGARGRGGCPLEPSESFRGQFWRKFTDGRSDRYTTALNVKSRR